MLMMYFIHKLYNAFFWLCTHRIITFLIDTYSYGDQICIFCFADSFDGIYCFKNKYLSHVSALS
jgi:hypothetical protein